MKKIILISIFLFTIISEQVSAQQINHANEFGRVLNYGLGIGGFSGYSRYVHHPLAVFTINREFQIADNITIAPFLSFYRYTNKYFWGSEEHGLEARNYYYHEMVIPVGVKGTYYLDKLLQASSCWDFYVAGSLGYAYVDASWDSDYKGPKGYFDSGSPLFLDVHVGAEYRCNDWMGFFFDLSASTATIGLSMH